MVEVAVTNVVKVFSQKRQRKVVALDGATFQAKTNEFVAVLGPSGCGKSTLLRIIAGLEQPTEGLVKIGEQPVTEPVDRLGMIFQDSVLLPWRDVISNIMLPLEMKHMDIDANRANVDALIKLVGLSGFESSYPYQLSGGMGQRVALCRALVIQPDLLLMDEPFGALDAITRERMSVELLKIWSNFRMTIIFVTHSIPEAVFLADRILVMSPRPGKFVSEFVNNTARPRKLSMLDDLEMRELAREIRTAIQGDQPYD